MPVERARRVADSSSFQRAVLVLIVVNAIVMGLETSRGLMEAWGPWLKGLEFAIQAAFVAEIAVRLAAHGRRPLGFFRDGWNVFDFLVVAVSLLPAAGPFATVARLARVLRVARVVSVLPDLRLIIGTMLRSIPSLGHVILLLALLLYIYGVLGFHLFGATDPEHWGTLARAVRTLFIIITLEGWVEILKAAGPPSFGLWVYFGSFIIVAVFVVINLFIAVVINNLEKTRGEDARAATLPVRLRIGQIREQLDALEAALGERAQERAPERAQEPAAARGAPPAGRPC